MKALILAVSMFLPFPFSTVSAQLTKLTVGYPSTRLGTPGLVGQRNGDLCQEWSGRAARLFQRRNHGNMALLSRQTPISQGAGQVVNAGLRGADTVVIAGGSVKIEWWLMTRPDIKSPEQLKRGTVAIAIWRPGRFFARIALKRLGLTPVKDIAFLQVGRFQERLLAWRRERFRPLCSHSRDAPGPEKGLLHFRSVACPIRVRG